MTVRQNPDQALARRLQELEDRILKVEQRSHRWEGVQETAWQTLPLGPDHVPDIAIPQIRKDSEGWVQVRGQVQRTANTNQIFTVPAGFEPPAQMSFTTWTSAGIAHITLRDDVGPSWEAGIYGRAFTSGFLSLDNIRWPSVDPHQLTMRKIGYRAYDDARPPIAVYRRSGMIELTGVCGTMAEDSFVSVGTYGSLRGIGFAVDDGANDGSLKAITSQDGLHVANGKAGLEGYGILGGITWPHPDTERRFIRVPNSELLNGWQNYVGGLTDWAPFSYWKDRNGDVQVFGAVTGGINGDCFVLPPGYRPAQRVRFPIMSDDRKTPVLGYCQIEPGGNVGLWGVDPAFVMIASICFDPDGT